MKPILLIILLGKCFFACTQTLQVHYDPRHTLAPSDNTRNFYTLYFEYFKNQDSGTAFIKPGSFLLKSQADLMGQKNNMGKAYLQVSQSFRCWQPKLFLNLQYSGGLGVTEPKQYSYYILNTFSLGLSYPFKWHNAYLTGVANYKFVAFPKPSHDGLVTLYWWNGLYNYRLEWLGDFSIWSENKNHGDEATKDMHGKRFSFFAEPQLWYNMNKILAAGVRGNLYYHINTTNNILNVYPSAGLRCKI